MTPATETHARAWVKVCGLTDPANAEEVAACGIDAVGINLFAKSKRYAALNVAERVAAAVAGSGVARVGLFVNAGAGEIIDAVRRLELDAVQLHGDESPAIARRLREAGLPEGVEIWRAVRVRRPSEAAMAADAWRGVASRLLLDAGVDGQYGGTGHRLPWNEFAGVGRRTNLPTTLAGGIGPHNVAEAIAATGLRAIDVASGVEESPGVKSVEAVRRLVANANEAMKHVDAVGEPTTAARPD